MSMNSVTTFILPWGKYTLLFLKTPYSFRIIATFLRESHLVHQVLSKPDLLLCNGNYNTVWEQKTHLKNAEFVKDKKIDTILVYEKNKLFQLMKS